MSVRAARTVLLLAIALLLATAWRGWRLDDVRPLVAPGLPLTGGETSTAEQREGYSFARVLGAVDKDPFHPERRRPARRFRLPGVVDAAPDVAARQNLMVKVIGTAVAADGGGFAMCAWGGGPPRIVRIGERIGDWTLRAVTPGAAEFHAAGGSSVIVRIAKAGEGS